MRLIIHTYIKEKEKLFLTAVYQILNVEGMTKLEKKKSSATITVLTDSDKNRSRMQKLVGEGTMLLLLLSCFSRVRLCATPYTAAHQAPLFLGFSRQEHWSGLPFPSPMHQSEK